MTELNMDPVSLNGNSRMNSKGRTVVFDSFKTLSDPVAYFAAAMNTELEHGTAGAKENTDVTHDDALSTARIAAAHIKGVERNGPERVFIPFVDYYDWLWFMEELHERAMAR